MKGSWPKKSTWFLLLFLTVVGGLIFALSWNRKETPPPQNRVQYYLKYSFNPRKGSIQLKKNLGNSPPNTGGFVTCSFTVSPWISHFQDQPQLCSALDQDLNLTFHLEEKTVEEQTFRIVQIRPKTFPTHTLLGETIDRGFLRLTYVKKIGWIRTSYRLQEIYQLFEQKTDPENFRAVESFTYDGSGNLKEFTESSALNFTDEDLYAIYNGKGELVQIPKMLRGSFIFPAKVDVSKVYKFEFRIFP